MIGPLAAIAAADPTRVGAAGMPWGGQVAAPGFAGQLQNTLQQVSDLEHRADFLIEDIATGGSTQIHEVMAATTQSSLAVDLMVAVRDRALEAYHEVMRMQL
ncbi:MAG: flagellar hook-basal body complex protein FliE [Nitriliruptoraceae bacterium]|nr:flagellar hook-basal body complex protein FliE [Nitriliruptoraceae bacterium]